MAKQQGVSGHLRTVVLQTASILLWLLFTGPALLLAFWLGVVGTRQWRLDKYWRHFPPQMGCDDNLLIDRCDGEKLFYLWLLTGVSGLAGVCLLATAWRPAGKDRRGAPGLNVISRALGRHVSPKRFWADWCGGLTVGDLCVVSTWFVINVLWACAIWHRYAQLIDVFKTPGRPLWRLELTLVSIALGQMLFPNLVLLFYPVTRGSVVLQVTGISYPDAVRYHRWLGHATMCLVTAHSLGFWGVWLSEGFDVLVREAIGQGRRINNLMGGLSFLFSLALWLTSLAVARRTNYDLFYKMHHVGFWGFMLFGCMHYWQLFWYFLPGLLLYAVDAVYRIMQVGDSSIVVSTALCSPDDRACCLVITAPNWGTAGTGYVWVNVPAISVTQWHPFEYITIDGPQPALMLHIKAYDRWTSALPKLIRKQGPTGVKLRLEGPYPELPPSPSLYAGDAMVIVAGGIGITAALSILQEMAALGEGCGRPALLVWAVRYPSELTFLGPKVLTMAGKCGLKLQVHLHYTGDLAELEEAAEMQQGGNIGAAAVIAIRATAEEDAVPSIARPKYELLWQLEPLTPPPHSNTTTLCPVLAVGSAASQAVQKFAVHGAVFAGALAAALAVRYHGVVLPDERWPTAWLGAAYVVLITLAALASGFTALAVSAACARLWRSPGSTTGSLHTPLLSSSQLTPARSDEEQVVAEGHASIQHAPEISPSQLAAADLQLQGSMSAGSADGCGCPEYMPGLPIVAGRPDLQALLSGWVAGFQDLPGEDDRKLVVQVLAMGPASMVAATQCLCDDLNCAGSKRMVLQFRQKTYQL